LYVDNIRSFVKVSKVESCKLLFAEMKRNDLKQQCPPLWTAQSISHFILYRPVQLNLHRTIQPLYNHCAKNVLPHHKCPPQSTASYLFIQQTRAMWN